MRQLRLAESGQRAYGVAKDLPAALALRVSPAEVVLLRTRAGYHIERRVRDVLADLAAHGYLRPASHLHVLDRAPITVRQELRECLAGFVHVVVGVEERDPLPGLDLLLPWLRARHGRNGPPVSGAA